MNQLYLPFDLPYYETPRNDNQRLLNIQFKYKVIGKAYLSEMYELLYKVAYKEINALSRIHKNVKEIPAEERREKAHNAAVYIIEQYLKRPDFAITTSMTGYLFKRVQHELFYHRKCDDLVLYMDSAEVMKNDSSRATLS